MPRFRRPVLVLVATSAFLATAIAQQAPQTGRVNGPVEQTVIDPIKAAIDLERQAKLLAIGQPQDMPLPENIANLVKGKLELSGMSLDAALPLAQGAVGNAGLQPGTQAAPVPGLVQGAKEKDVKALGDLALGLPAGKIVKNIEKALMKKKQAKRLLQGQDASPKAVEDDDPERLDPSLPSDADVNRLNATHAHDKSFMGNKEVQHGKVVGAKKKQKKYEDKDGRAFRLPPDYYFGFRAAGGAASGGFAVMHRDRELKGPFQARVTAGAFTASPKALAALGDAFACFEFDVKGSSPLEFLSVCARPTDGGVQVFASTAAGNLGQLFIAGTNTATLDVVYDGTTFTCGARSPSQFNFTQFATFVRPQAADAWTLSVGGAGLGGAVEVGVDDIAIWAITR